MPPTDPKVLWNELKAMQMEMDRKLSGIFVYSPGELEEIFRKRAQSLALREEAAAEPGQPVLVCAAGLECFAFPLSGIEKICVPSDTTDVPDPFPGLRGVLNFQNEILPVVSFAAAARLGEAAEQAGIIVILAHEGMALGCELDRIVEIRNIPEDLWTASPKHPLIPRIAPYRGGVVGLVDIPAFFQRIQNAAKEGFK